MNWPREITWGGERGSYWNERDCVKTYAEFACSYLVQDLCCSSEYISCRITKYQSKIVKFHAFQHCWVLAFNRYTLEYSLETCNECGKSFKETGNLKIHKMILSLHVLSILIWVVTWNNIRWFTSCSWELNDEFSGYLEPRARVTYIDSSTSLQKQYQKLYNFVLFHGLALLALYCLP